MKTKEAIANIMAIISIALFVWFVASWIDIVADNHKANPTHSEWNLITMVVDATDNVKGE